MPPISAPPEDVIQILITYLESKDISSSTKTEILSTLNLTSRSMPGAQGMVNANLPPTLVHLLLSPDHKVLQFTCRLLGDIAPILGDKSVVNMNGFQSLVLLLRHPTSEVHGEAAYALAKISRKSDIGACASVYSSALPALVTLLQSPDREVVRWTCRVLGNMALEGSLIQQIIDADPSVPLVSLLSRGDIGLQAATLYALHNIASSSESGARAVVYANVLPPFASLLESVDKDSLTSACMLIGSIASHKNLLPSLLSVEVCAPLVSLLRNPAITVQRAAGHALSQISCRSEGVEDVVVAGTLLVVPELLQSSDSELLEIACHIIGHIARIPSQSHAVVHVDPWPQLVTLLSHPDVTVQLAALRPLLSMSRTESGARSVADSNTVPAILELLRSTNVQILQNSCKTLSNLARRRLLSLDIVAGEDSLPLSGLLRHPDSRVHVAALSLLFHLSSIFGFDFPAIIDAKPGIVELIQDNVDDLDSQHLLRACTLLGSIVRNEVLEPEGAIDVSPCLALISVLRLSPVTPTVQCAAVYALHQISCRSERDACTVVDAKALPVLLGLLASSGNRWISVHVCQILGGIASHSRLSRALIESGAAPPLAQLLKHPNKIVRYAGACALDQIADHSSIVAYAIINTRTSPELVELLQSDEEDVVICTCKLLAQIGDLDDDARKAVTEADACRPLGQLLRHPNIAVRLGAVCALFQISRSEYGVHSIVNANASPALVELLCVPDAQVLHVTCKVIASIAQHGILVAAVIDAGVCLPLVSLLSHEECPPRADKLSLKGSAARALCLVSCWETVPVLVNLLQSTDQQIRHWTSRALTNILEVALANVEVGYLY
ncbi:armadillo-type protein [Mycena sp. CBHHK59/15]|nr:armadillo-type protein [Mycena sp. CBHHK59/15]